MRALDGRDGGSEPLLERLEALFGPARGLPGKLYPRPDRPAVLASFAPEVGRCAAADPVAAGILRAAARHIAAAAAAACPPAEPERAAEGPDRAPDGRDGAPDGPGYGGVAAGPGAASRGHAAEPREVSLTGGLFRLGEPLLGPLREELRLQIPHARSVPAQGDPLSGALRVATALATDRLTLPADGALLRVVR